MNEGASILIVDDHPALVDGVTMTLTSAGYSVLAAGDGTEALETLETVPIDLILADIAMPGMNGYQLLERVRQNPEWVPIPFIFLTARALDSDVRYGKELGADDYLTKPIDPEDLLAAVQGRLVRAQQFAQLASQPARTAPVTTQPLTVGRLRIDPGQHRLWLNDKPLEVSAREFTLLACLAQHLGQVVPPEDLILATHELQTDRVEAGMLLRPLIRSLRRKLGYPVGETGCIETVRGVGYRLVAP